MAGHWETYTEIVNIPYQVTHQGIAVVKTGKYAGLTVASLLGSGVPALDIFGQGYVIETGAYVETLYKQEDETKQRWIEDGEPYTPPSTPTPTPTPPGQQILSEVNSDYVYYGALAGILFLWFKDRK